VLRVLAGSVVVAACTNLQLAPLLATVLPVLIMLGIFTFVRLVETNVEDAVCCGASTPSALLRHAGPGRGHVLPICGGRGVQH
jgi:hypothetical protein